MPESLAVRLSEFDQCTTSKQMHTLCTELLSVRGIVAYSYTHLPPFGVDHLQVMVPITSRNFAPEFVKIYGEKEWFRIDPFIKHAMRTSDIVKWSEIEHIERKSPELKEFFDTMAATVQGDGLGVPAYGPNNTNGYFALATGVDNLNYSPEVLNEIHCICNAMHIRYCQWAGEQRLKCSLSGREIETMKFVIRGLSTQEIAKEMKVSAHTVNTYLKRAFEKLDVSDRVSASMRFLALGYLFE